MNYWSRNDTKEWISQLEHRIEDIDYYLSKTAKWCEDYGIDNNQVLFMCSFLTCIWVSQLRNEPITFGELMEMLGIEEWETDSSNEEKLYELDDQFCNLDHFELLEQAVKKFESDF